MKRFLLLLVLLAGCSAPPVSTPPAPVPGFSAGWYLQAESAGKKILRIDARQSLIAVTVHRGGALARLGHDHVVASRGITGFVAPDDGRADFHFRLDEMSIDEPGLRREAGFDTQPPADAIAGTRRNMLTKTLDAARYPFVLLHAERAAQGDSMLHLTITLQGVTRTVVVPTRIERMPEGLAASGTLSLLQSDFGITSMSVLGGAIQVLDRTDLRFSIVATQRAATRAVQ